MFVDRQRETEIRRRHERTEMRIQQLQQSQKNKLNIFGSWAPNVVNKIKALEKEGKFHRTPVGPLGKFGIDQTFVSII